LSIILEIVQQHFSPSLLPSPPSVLKLPVIDRDAAEQEPLYLTVETSSIQNMFKQPKMMNSAESNCLIYCMTPQ